MDESEIQTAMKLKVATQLLADSERENEKLKEQVEQLKCKVDQLEALVLLGQLKGTILQ